MASSTVFDRYGTITETRKAFLGALLQELGPALDLRTALDAGCGVGVFSAYLQTHGLVATGVDARPENIAEARARYPQMAFQVADVEDPVVLQTGPRDLVLSFGLLYHLENPFRAVRHLAALTGKVMVIESMVFPSRFPRAALVDEVHEVDQGLRHVALVPSESCLVAMLYRAGFSAVHRPARLPDHDEFHPSLSQRQRRTILVAARSRVAGNSLHLVPDRRPRDPWVRRWAQPAVRALRRVRGPQDPNP
jgi:SAM-dependent methyltransferase